MMKRHILLRGALRMLLVVVLVGGLVPLQALYLTLPANADELSQSVESGGVGISGFGDAAVDRPAVGTDGLVESDTDETDEDTTGSRETDGGDSTEGAIGTESVSSAATISPFASSKPVTLVWSESLTVADATKHYGDPDPQYVLIGLPNGLVQGVDYTVTFERYDVGESVDKTVGYRVRVKTFTFLNPDYELQGNEHAMKEGRLFITERPITITANSDSKVYNNTPLTSSGYTIGGSGLASGNTATVVVLGSQTNVGSSANTFSTVTIMHGVTDVTSSYAITTANGTLTVTKCPLIVKAEDKTVDFGNPPPIYTITYSGFVSGQSAADLTTQPTATSVYAFGNEAGNYPITVSGGSANNYNLVYQQGTLTVRANTAAVTVIAKSKTKTYDGTVLTEPAYTVTGLPAGFTLTTTVTGSATIVADSVMGNNVVGTVVIRDTSLSDVTASFSNIIKVNGTLTITPAPLKAEVADMTIGYNDAIPTYTVTYSGFVNGETMAVLTSQTAFACTYTQGASAGTYPITGSGAAAANYTVNYLPGVLTVAKNATLITVTAASQSKVYDGLPLINSDYTVVTGSSLPAGHTLEATVSGAATNVADSIPSNNVVTAVVVKNADGLDVTANFSNVVKVNGGLVITRAPLTANVDDKTIGFGQAEPPYTVTYSGFVNGETSAVITTPISFTDNYSQGDPAGTYSIIGSDATAANYTINYLPGVLTVHPDGSHITVTARSASKVYDGTPIVEAGYDVVGLPAEYTLTANVASSVPITNVDDDGVNKNTVIDYTIKRISDSADVTEDFSNVLLVTGSLSITPALLTIEMIDYAVAFDDPAPTYEVTYTGFITGENENNALSNLVVPACAYIQGTTPAGTTLSITEGSGTMPNHGNYVITYLPGTLVVAQYSNQVTVQAGYSSKVYDGTPLTDTGYVITGVPSDFTYAVTTTGSATTVADGSVMGNNPVGAVTIYNSSMQDVTSSFQIVTVPGTLTITPAPLTANVTDMSVVYGDIPPEYSVSYTGFVLGESESVLTSPTDFSCSYTQGSNAGTYPITGSSAAADNYTITYLPGTLTVHQDSTPIIITGAYDTKTYDGTPLFNTTTTEAGLPGGYSYTATVTGSATNVEDSIAGNNVVGDVRIWSGSIDVTANFSHIIVVNGMLTITPAHLLANVTDMSVTFGDPVPTYTVAYSGFMNGEDESIITTPITLTGAYVAGDSAGTYPITGSGAAANNYEISYLPGVLTVQQNATPITILGAYDTKVYDGTPLVNATTNETGLPDGYSYTATVTGSATNVADGYLGNNVVSNVQIWSGPTDVTANFSNVAIIDGTLTVTSAPLTVEANDLVVTYLDPAPTYALTYTGFQGLDGPDDLTVISPVSSSYSMGSPARNYPINEYVATAANYTVNFLPGTLAVHKNSTSIIAAASSASKVYDGTPLTSSAYTTSPDWHTALPAGHTLQATVVGTAVNVSDSVSNNNHIVSYTIRNASNVDVTDSFSGIVTVPGTLTIVQAPLTATMDSIFLEEGSAVPAYTMTYSGWVNNEDESVLSTPTIGVSGYTPSSPFGSQWPITGSGAIANYDNYSIVYQPGTLFVQSTRELITLAAPSASKTYDGLALSASDIISHGLPEGYTVEGVVEGSVTNVPDSGIFNNVIVSYTIRNNQGDDVTSSFANVQEVKGSLSIIPREIIIDVDDATKIKGESDPAFTAAILNPVLSDDAIEYTLRRTAGEDVGTYAIEVTSFVENPNYQITTEPGVFTITAPVELTSAESIPSKKTSQFAPTTLSATGDDVGGGMIAIALLALCIAIMGVVMILARVKTRKT